ncbi:MAG: MTAP family purine nucleoside phosphorylase [Methanosarcinales archaeon]|nr:MTAP family purine nucleoside phosphorylase [ANME-2 cluster archaeon]MDF1530808.1 MTAP family purine nucleoside phosphorylase [ANME-2 cluster archaeon]MDW7776465.1 MTAP family purine nucleoside phosphorylase [Methanosarcinales archaeon]
MPLRKQHDIDAVLIGGVGFRPEEYGFRDIEVTTPYGIVKAKQGTISHNDRELALALIGRHTNSGSARGEHLPPHRLNYRANVWAAKALGSARVIATNSVGTMGDHPPGSFLVANDFIDLTRSRVNTFFDEETVHVDMTEPYCPEIGKCLTYAMERGGLAVQRGVYVCTEGPRFETAAEIRMLQSFGDVVGMTGLPEVVLARELGLCYATLCIITNRACGLAGKKLTADEVLDMLDKQQELLRTVILDAVALLPEQRDCDCQYATHGATIS